MSVEADGPIALFNVQVWLSSRFLAQAGVRGVLGFWFCSAVEADC